MDLSHELPVPEVPAAVLNRAGKGPGRVPPAGQVVSGGGQGQFDGRFLQTPLAKLPHPAWFFQHSEDRFHQRLAFSIHRGTLGTPQLLAQVFVGGES